MNSIARRSFLGSCAAACLLLAPSAVLAAPAAVPGLTHIANCGNIVGKTAILPANSTAAKGGQAALSPGTGDTAEWSNDGLTDTKWTIVWTTGAGKGKLISSGGINDLVEEPTIIEQDDDHAVMVMQYDYAYWTYTLFVKSQRILVTAHKTKWIAGKAIGHLFAGTCTFSIAR
jgi:hypothetical protein